MPPSSPLSHDVVDDRVDKVCELIVRIPSSISTDPRPRRRRECRDDEPRRAYGSSTVAHDPEASIPQLAAPGPGADPATAGLSVPASPTELAGTLIMSGLITKVSCWDEALDEMAVPRLRRLW